MSAIENQENMRGSLLLVDDEPQVCSALKRVLRREGYEVHTASGPDEAMEVLSAHPIDVIVSDQRMPARLGTQFLADVRAAYPSTVRIILSGAADIEDVAQAMESGVIYKFLTKPIDPALLRANVSEAFARAALIREAVAAAPSSRDEQTGLLSRSRLEEIYPNALETARLERRHVCLLMLKIDQYDSVLSSFGYSFGRRFLQAVARSLASLFGGDDLLAHDAPGTFLLLTAAPDPEKRIRRIDAQIDRLFGEPLLVDERRLTATVSIGATATAGEGRFDELLDQAYAAMKTGSERGGATMQIFQPQIVNAFRSQLELETELRQATQDGAFMLHYQPQVDLTSGRIVGLEALIRWPHPLRGVVSPADFVPIAERTGLIREIGIWVLETAIEQLVAWDRLGIDFGEMAINVSALQLKNSSFTDRVARSLRRCGLDASRLVLEITESAAIGEQQALVDSLEAFRDLGVTLAIDDFGTGYANVANLTRFPFKKLKIDRSLLPHTDDERAERLYANVVAMAKELGLEVVAEGVESPGELAFVHSAGCRVVQGYFYSPPVPPDRLLGLSGEKRRTAVSC